MEGERCRTESDSPVSVWASPAWLEPPGYPRQNTSLKLLQSKRLIRTASRSGSHVVANRSTTVLPSVKCLTPTTFWQVSAWRQRSTSASAAAFSKASHSPRPDHGSKRSHATTYAAAEQHARLAYLLATHSFCVRRERTMSLLHFASTICGRGVRGQAVYEAFEPLISTKDAAGSRALLSAKCHASWR